MVCVRFDERSLSVCLLYMYTLYPNFHERLSLLLCCNLICYILQRECSSSYRHMYMKILDFFYSSYIWTLLLCHLFTRRVRRVGVKQFFLSLWWVLVDGYNFLGKLHWTLESNVKHKTAITTRKLKNKMHPQTVVRALTA